MGSRHLRVLEAMPGVEVVAAVDADARRLAAAAARPGVARYARLTEAVRATAPDFACVATPVRTLPLVVAEALATGVAVLAEKPLAPDVESAEELVALALAQGVLLRVGYVERFNPAVHVVKAELEAGRIGSLLRLHSRRFAPGCGRPPAANVALDLAIHDLDVMRYLTGSDIGEVAAESAGEDVLAGVVRFRSGVVGVVEASRRPGKRLRELLAVGDRGSLALDYVAQTVVLRPRRGRALRLAVPRAEPLRLQWQAFTAALRNGSEARVADADALAALASARRFRLGSRSAVVTAAR